MSREVAGRGVDGAQKLSWLGGQWANSSGQYSIYLILVAMIVISSFLSPAFLSVANFANISRQISITTILAFGQTILIIGGMLDLSCGSVMALSGLLAVLVFKATGFGPVALGAGILTGVLANSINGLMVTVFRLPPFIATLAMLTSARGAALLLTSGQPVYQLGAFRVWG
jgi:inositol transport system permease protein